MGKRAQGMGMTVGAPLGSLKGGLSTGDLYVAEGSGGRNLAP